MSGSYNLHSVLSASGAHRWMNCLPSAILEQEFPNVTNIYAQEGTVAHDLCEYKLKTALDMKAKKPVDDLINDEMEEYTDIYVEYCLQLIEQTKEECQDLQILIEQRLDFSDYVPDGFGTGDLVIVADKTLHVIDFKYGKGQLVIADRNPQMMLYALGALSLFEMLYDIEYVSMTIVQPRIDNFSTDEMTVGELKKWAEEILKPKALLASRGEGEFCAGDHCKFCRAKHQCRERAKKNLELLKYDFKESSLLTDDEIAEIITLAGELSKWASDIYTYASVLAIEEGKQWPGFKLVHGRSRRKYRDEKKIIELAKANGYEDIFKQTLISITQMEKLMGKKTFKEILGDFVETPKGKLTLVDETDKRKAVEPISVEFQAEI